MAGAEPFLFLILSSPSGAGKTTLGRRLLAEFRDLHFSVSHTTRAPRASEVDGRDYHFVDDTTFDRMVREDAFVEWAHVHAFRYGTSVAEVERARVTAGGIAFDIDYQGAEQIKSRHPEAIGVFILPPSMDELLRRLRGRATDDERSVQRRFAKAREEIGHYVLFDYLLVNDELDATFDRLRGIVLAERSRRERNAEAALALLRP